MPSFNFILLTIVGCGIATGTSRVLPFLLLKRLSLSPQVLEFLSFVPLVIMSVLWFENLFTQHLGHVPEPNLENMLASLPTVISAIISKSLLIVVIVGIISLAIIRLLS
ncbi:AzlD domain-containing protein [Weissella diestrammenae]|uniref:AzlD domain-containing protein n=1 Tax=Weissella diestrammenae TaxID=1162633 RepID=A0A7G9T559_9LACO|nr:AzlD domain-containing protein [Weissella diestrammenae]MCM0583090.1 AzlD domain-containing protein [Weissella diestrammenae]QNN75234.1 AzlD domain-containing protein [Weissella diestrammenae]